MDELLKHIRTPLHREESFLVVVLTILGLFVLVACKRDIPDGVLTLLGVLVPGYFTASQMGNTSRMKAAAGVKPDAPAPPAAP